MSEDPAGDPNNPNLYSYCRNNPLRIIDPTGLDGYDPSTGTISHPDGTITDTDGNTISTPPGGSSSGYYYRGGGGSISSRVTQDQAQRLCETYEKNDVPQYIQKLINDTLFRGVNFQNAFQYGIGLFAIQLANNGNLTESPGLFRKVVAIEEVQDLENKTGLKFDTSILSIMQVGYDAWTSGTNIAAMEFLNIIQRVNQLLDAAGLYFAWGLINNIGKLPNNPEGEFKPFNFKNNEPLLNVNNKADALKAVENLPPPIQKSIKDFFKGGSNAYTKFTVEKTPEGNYLAKMTKPGKVPGSKANYYKEISSDGTSKVYKDTFDPFGNLVHRKNK